MKSDVKKCKEDLPLRKLSLSDLQRVRGGVNEDLFAAGFAKFFKFFKY
jgi:hypothetical protein